MQNRGPGVRVVHRADMPSGFRFRAVERAEFCFAVDLREMKIPTSIKDCQVSVRDCTARLTGDQPDELKLAESKEHSIAHTTKEASVEVAQTWASRKPEHTHVFCFLALAKHVLREDSRLLTCMSSRPMAARFVRVVWC